MIKYFTQCKICKADIEQLHGDLPIPNRLDCINVYMGKKLITTYCSTSCLKKDFRIKKFKKKVKYLFFFEKEVVKNIWVNKKDPNKHYKIIFYNF